MMNEDSPDVLIARIERICADQVKKFEHACGGDAALSSENVKRLEGLTKVLLSIRAEQRRIAEEDKLVTKSDDELQAILKGAQV